MPEQAKSKRYFIHSLVEEVVNERTEYMKHDLEETVESLKKLIVETIGEDYLSVDDIKKEDNLNNDLDMDSIEVVTLAEKIKSTYGEDVDFAMWLSGLEINEIITLTVERIARFIVECRS